MDDETEKDIDYSLFTNMAASVTLPYSYNWSSSTGTVTISTTNGASGNLYSSAGLNGTSYYTAGSSSSYGSGLHVSGDAEFAGDIKIKGRSLEKLLQTIEDRLAILQDPDPKKLEKYAALKKAYDHYKTLERLIGED